MQTVFFLEVCSEMIIVIIVVTITIRFISIATVFPLVNIGPITYQIAQ